MYRQLLILFLAVLLGGCDQLFGTTKVIHIDSPAPLSDQDSKIITQRLREHTSTLAPAYNISYSNGEIIIQAKGAPGDSEIQYLLMHQGLFQVKTEGGMIWFTQRDILDAQPGLDDQQRVTMNLKLSKEAGSRLATMSSASLGKIVIVEFDGKVLTFAKISSPIPDGRLQITINTKSSEAFLMGAILRSGALSFLPSSVKITSK